MSDGIKSQPSTNVSHLKQVQLKIYSEEVNMKKNSHRTIIINENRTQV